jgi:hypothetical protein
MCTQSRRRSLVQPAKARGFEEMQSKPRFAIIKHLGIIAVWFIVSEKRDVNPNELVVPNDGTQPNRQADFRIQKNLGQREAVAN